jgi:hypothetical protein
MFGYPMTGMNDNDDGICNHHFPTTVAVEIS